MLKSFIAPSAKFSALDIEYIVGSSITMSKPASKADFVLDHLSIKAGSPTLHKIATHYAYRIVWINYFF